MSTLPFLFNIALEVLTTEKRQIKKEGININKDNVKLLSFKNDDCVCRKSSESSNYYIW